MLPEPDFDRRRFLQLAGAGLATVAVPGAPPALAAGAAGAPSPEGLRAQFGAGRAVAVLGDARIALLFDAFMQVRLVRPQQGRAAAFALSDFAPAGFLTPAAGAPMTRFELSDHRLERTSAEEGAGWRLLLTGRAEAGIEKRLEVRLLERFPGVALQRCSYRNTGAAALRLVGWTAAEHGLPPESPAAGEGAVAAGATSPAGPPAPPFWSYCGSSHADRRDWVQPVRPGFAQDNFMGMSAAADYGGGTPITAVWRRDVGLAIGHLAPRPRLLSLPLRCDAQGATVAMRAQLAGHAEGREKSRGWSLAPGEVLELPEFFVALHTGDHFSVLEAYRRLMALRGLELPAAPASAFEPIWCAWGYERECTPERIVRTLPKVRELGLRWAVVDDGWQNEVGDWGLDATKYPGGEADMRQLVDAIHAQELKARLWYAPLATAPGSDLLHDHTDMLLLDPDGAVQNVSWWNSFYLCPAYGPTVRHTQVLVRHFMQDWNYDGLKLDGQHLDAVAPCYNPAHHHARPEESCEALQDFMRAIYDTARAVKPQACLEWCPCGTGYSFFNFTAMNQAPASDPESSWQVRLKGKTLKALMGPGGAFAGDHVELSDGGEDFASTVGIGAIVSTKFTWPEDPKPKDSFLLTPEREALWRRWIRLFKALDLPHGEYRGELYDIGFDRPEMHAIGRAGRMYYACFAPAYAGAIELRGLTRGRWRVRDCFDERTLGEVSARRPQLQVDFRRFLLLEAQPA